MITKERLEELIEQGATIYENKEGHILEISFDNENIRLGYKVSGIYLTFGIQEPIIIAKIENLFETKEDARWELEMTATKTETLKLPTWEEFFNSGKSIVFRGVYGDIQELKQYNREIYINEQYCGYLTKENYIEACKLCKKLFLGEEV